MTAATACIRAACITATAADDAGKRRMKRPFPQKRLQRLHDSISSGSPPAGIPSSPALLPESPCPGGSDRQARGSFPGRALFSCRRVSSEKRLLKTFPATAKCGRKTARIRRERISEQAGRKEWSGLPCTQGNGKTCGDYEGPCTHRKAEQTFSRRKEPSASFHPSFLYAPAPARVLRQRHDAGRAEPVRRKDKEVQDKKRTENVLK